MSYVSRYELRNAYEDCIKKKRNTKNAIDFEVDDNIKLENLYKELNTFTYKIGKSIVFTLIHPISNKPFREVFAADFKDRIVHHLLINRLLPKIEKHDFIDDCYACRKNKGTLYGALQCYHKLNTASNNGKVKELYVLKGDLKNCFNNLNKHLLYKKFETFIKKYFKNDKNIIFNLFLLHTILFHCPQRKGNYIRKQPKLFWKILPYEKSMFHCDDIHGIAVGNLTSQIFANFYLSLLDHYIVCVLGYTYYGRYVDDFYLFNKNKEKLLNDYKLIIEFVKDIGLTVNINKTYIQHYKHGLKFIGYMIHYNRIYIKNETKTRFYKSIYEFTNIIKHKFHNCNISLITLKRFIPTWNSYIGIFSHCYAHKIIIKLQMKYRILFSYLHNVSFFDVNNYLHINKDMKKLENLYYLHGITKSKMTVT